MTSSGESGGKMLKSQSIAMVMEPATVIPSAGTHRENSDARGSTDTVPFSVVPARRGRLVKLKGGRWMLAGRRY